MQRCALPAFAAKPPGGIHETGDPAAIASTAFLTLPALAAGIPAKYTQSDHPAIEMLAEQLAELGMIDIDDPVSGQTFGQAAERAMNRAICDAVGDFDSMYLRCHLTDDASGYGFYFEQSGDMRHVTLMIETDGAPTVQIGDRLAELDALCPGAAQTISAVLNKINGSCGFLFNFQYVFEGVPFLYRLDEREFIDETDPEEREEFEHYPTKEELLEGIPDDRKAWVLSPQLVVPMQEFERLAEVRTTPGWAKEILEATLDVARCWPDGKYCLEVACEDREPVYPLAWVQISSGDAMGRIMDDYIEMANSCGDAYITALHFEKIDASSKEGVKGSLEKFLAGLKLLKAIMRLLYALDTPAH